MDVTFHAAESQNILIPATYDIFWSAVAFAIIFFFFWKNILPKVSKTLEERAQKIEGGIKKAENAQAEADALKAEYQKSLVDAREEAAKIREQARTDGEEIIKQAKSKAAEEAQRVTETAHLQIEAERAAALSSLKGQVGTLASDLASKIVGESLNDDARSQRVVDRFLADLDNAETASSNQGN